MSIVHSGRMLLDAYFQVLLYFQRSNFKTDPMPMTSFQKIGISATTSKPPCHINDIRKTMHIEPIAKDHLQFFSF